MGKLPGSNSDRNKMVKRALLAILIIAVVSLIVMGVQNGPQTKKMLSCQKQISLMLKFYL